MVFLEFTKYSSEKPVLINIEAVTAIEDLGFVTCIDISGSSQYVKESYADIVAFMRDHECGVF